MILIDSLCLCVLHKIAHPKDHNLAKMVIMSKPSLNRLLPKFHRHTEEDTSALLSPERTGEATGQGESPNKIKRGRCSVFEHLGAKSATDVLKNLDSIFGSRTIPIKFIATTHEDQPQPLPPLILESCGSGTSSFKHSYIILIYWILLDHIGAFLALLKTVLPRKNPALQPLPSVPWTWSKSPTHQSPDNG